MRVQPAIRIGGLHPPYLTASREIMRMKWPRPRFKLWMPMIAIAIVALGLGLHQRSVRLARISFAYSVEASRLEGTLIGPSGTSKDGPSSRESDEILDQVHWNDTVAGQFDKAACRPWLLIDPDPQSITCNCGHHSR